MTTGEVLSKHNNISFTVSKRLLAGGRKKDVGNKKTETDIFRRKETENCSDFGEGDSP